MDYNTILNYFEDSAKSGYWNSLYDPKNPYAYACIVRLHKAINLARPFKNKKVLDLGCGTGVLMPFVINEKGQYIGLDASEKMLHEIKRIYPDYIDKEGVSLVSCDINNVALPDNLDIIVGLGFIEYLDNPQKLIEGLHNKLRDNGRLILSFPNSRSLDYISVKCTAPLRSIARVVLGKSTPQPPRKLWSVKDARNLYANSGFKNLRVTNYNVNILAYPLTRISTKFSNILAKRFEYTALSRFNILATGFLIYGEK